jgi:outer membrane protein assembly factor BamB
MRISLFSLLVVSCWLALAGCGAASATPTTSHATPPSASTDTPTPAPTPVLASQCPKVPVAAAGAAPAAPLSVYVTSSGATLAALNASDGTQRWKEQVGFAGDYQVSVAVQQNVVYVLIQQAQGGFVEALNAADGKLRWCVLAIRPVNPNDGGGPSQLAIDANAVYAGDGLRGQITALSVVNGGQLWQAQAEGGILALRAAAGQVYASSADMSSEFATAHTFSAFDAGTGQERWHMPTDEGQFFAPAIDAGVVYVAQNRSSGPGYLFALNTSDGSQRWRIAKGQGVGFGAPTVANGVIFIADSYGVYALNASDGSQRWHTQKNTSFAQGPVVANGTVYAGAFGGTFDQGVVYAFGASDGKQRWQSESFARLHLAPLTSGPDPVTFLSVANGTVYASASASSAALDPSTGMMLWQVSARALAVG